ncbi:MAG TPA: YceI family protein [Chitinophagaceae bacterium]|jgi:polyisoprenoid-binding protein YceI|nr:YceI family protein [Chitinophagaceae bacterium]
MKLLLLIPLFIVLPELLLTGNWNADTANAKITFTVDGPFGTVDGSFTGLKATFQFDANDLPGSYIKATVDPATVSTGNWLRNHHLRSEDQFLNTSKYPLLGFTSTKIEKTPTGFKATGNLSLKGITKPIEIPFTFSNSGNSGFFKGQFAIQRMDYNIGTEGGTVGNTITIHIAVPVTK